jgi:hypothetical protein
MKVSCLASQEKLFEARILKRMAEPVFLPLDQLQESLQTPLLLFGNWHESGFWEGLRWLSTVAYRLSFPCILCPPFEPGQIGQLLALQVSLEVKVINTNSLTLQEKGGLQFSPEKRLKVQADFGFTGPAGKPFVTTSTDNVPVVLALQPKNIVTPLVLCGVRLFSASGLSAEVDRQALFEALVTWATAQHGISSSIEPAEVEADDLNPEILKSLVVLLVGTGARTLQEVSNLASSVLGLTLTPLEFDLSLDFLVQNGLVQREGESFTCHPELLEQYAQQLGLWPYVRILRRNFAG